MSNKLIDKIKNHKHSLSDRFDSPSPAVEAKTAGPASRVDEDLDILSLRFEIDEAQLELTRAVIELQSRISDLRAVEAKALSNERTRYLVIGKTLEDPLPSRVTLEVVDNNKAMEKVIEDVRREYAAPAVADAWVEEPEASAPAVDESSDPDHLINEQRKKRQRESRETRAMIERMGKRKD